MPAYDVNMFASVEGYIQDAIPAFTEWILTRKYLLHVQFDCADGDYLQWLALTMSRVT